MVYIPSFPSSNPDPTMHPVPYYGVKGEAIVEFSPEAKVTDEQIQKAVRAAGFTPGKIEWK
jgi:hypothetical protein